MLFKAVIVIILVLILLSLASALFSMLRGNQDSTRTVKALTVRIALSIGLLIFIMIGYSLGLISPHALI
ncbi:twin transmembrane helix small protein [Thiohalophilus sp.]|uniref:twin transmembrane helix small protein n=1 Tax=Thiohalophilus sp. TaxID=3028392 RepID=UPI002ACE380F|nr:twin transmembrane helix small protein [Thiohalophilus sp.]MDZ7661753.1 twin transmembrane helix small protein [Thiohalophilus sp.]